ncbi:hypothetical protein Tco_0446102 [Tanacetum coccineum]
MRIIKVYKEFLKLKKYQISQFYFWCISTQSSSNQNGIYFPYPDKSLQFRQVEESESDNLFLDHIQGEDENAEDVQMADHLRPMEELLRIPIIGIENAIVVPAVLANEFELKPSYLILLNQVPDDVVKFILFSFSLKGAAETWLENKPPNSITSWDDLVSKKGLKRQKEAKTIKNRQETGKRQRVKSKSKESAKDHSRISPTQK